jgi:2-dehydropantoate 2-reductase
LKKFCYESTNVAKTSGFNLDYDDMLNLTIEVISDTRDNFSSMLQSLQNGKKTEIDSINGFIVEKGRIFGVETPLNEIICQIVRNFC